MARQQPDIVPRQQSSPASPVRAGIVPIFSTWIYECREGPGERISIAFNVTNP
jgi:hypothetical protein